MNEIIKNKKILIVFIVVVICFAIGFSFASVSEFFSNYAQSRILRVDEEAYGNLEFDSNNLEFVPILDTNVVRDSTRFIYIEFRVGGSDLNDHDNITYDIALADLEVDCELLSPYLKWRLVKNNEMISEGSLDYKFDTILDGRLVLTPIQQDLKEYSEDKQTYDYFQFYMWISDSLQDPDLSNYNGEDDQSNLSGRQIKGKIEVELYGGTKKELVRKPSSEINHDTCFKGESRYNESNMLMG